MNYDQLKTIHCTNCGNVGHSTKACISPSISLGIILFKFVNDEVLYTCIRRRDSYAFSDFKSEKYKLQDPIGMQRMFNNMTTEELQMIKDNVYNTSRSSNRSFLYKNKQQKYKTLCAGYNINGIEYSLRYYLENISVKYNTPEWGFPKGRRNKHETELECAKREMREETNIRSDEYIILNNFQRLEEDLIGGNNVHYKYYYYVAIAKQDITLMIDKTNNDQVYEVGKIKWLLAKKIISLLREPYIHRKRMIKMLDDKIKYTFLCKIPDQISRIDDDDNDIEQMLQMTTNQMKEVGYEIDDSEF